MLVKIGLAIGAGYIGFYLPNMLSRTSRSAARPRSNALSRSLGMLLICVHSSISIEAAFQKVASEVGASRWSLRGSFRSRPRSFLICRTAGTRPTLGKSTGTPRIKAVPTARIQAERYGTPGGQALRVIAREKRDMRMAEAEKKAPALPPKLSVPMIVFFLPVLFVMILGPALIQVFGYQ
jgi:tight adherence protein C